MYHHAVVAEVIAICETLMRGTLAIRT